MIHRIWPWLAAALTGALLTLCFPPFEYSGFAFLALVPLLSAVWLGRVNKRPGRRHFALGWLAGVLHFGTVFSWIGELGPLFDSPLLRGLPWLLALYLGLYPAVFAWFAGWLAGGHFRPGPLPLPGEPFVRPPLLLSTRNLALSIALATMWTALEWVRGWLFSGFGWNGLGVALSHPAHLPLLQIADITGVGGISFLLVMCNAIALITVLRLLAEIGRIRIRPHFDFSLTVLLLVIAFAYGVRKITRPENDTIALRIVSIQPNIPQRMKLRDRDESVAAEIRETLAKHHLVATLSRPHLTLWPEACIPGGLFGSEENHAFVTSQAALVPALITGTDDLFRGGPGEDYNSAAFLLSGQKDIELYDKRHLVPFGEYFPLKSLYAWALGDMVGGDFNPGNATAVWHLPEPDVKLGPIICFEDTIPGVARQPVQSGAQVLINLTNDAWFGESAESRQHLLNARLRAIENRRPLVRCTNTGITSSIDALGAITLHATPFTGETRPPFTVAVPRMPEMTFYTQHGERFSQLCALTSIAVLGWRIRRRPTAIP